MELLKNLLKNRVIRFIISGGVAFVVVLLSVYILNSLLHLYYLLASILAFIFGFSTSFSMHRFWTFESNGAIHKEGGLYLLVSLGSLLLNTILIYLFVGHLGQKVLVAQFFSTAICALLSFLFNYNFVFKKKGSDIII